MTLTKVSFSMLDGAPINVKDFGAVGDGITNDTAAIQAAINSVQFYYPMPTTVAQTGGHIYFPRGIYLVDGLTIENTVANNGYTNGIFLSGEWAVLKGSAACTKIISIDAAGRGTPQKFTNGVRIKGLQFDLTAMTTVGAEPYLPGSVGLWIRNAAHGRYENLTFFGGPTNNVHIQLVDNGSASTFTNIDCSKIQIDGEDYALDYVVTTTNFYNVSCTGFKVSAAWGLNFYGCIVQNPGDNYGAAFVLENCRHITIIGGDFEGTTGSVFEMVNNVANVVAMNNTVSSLPIYILGEARNSDFQDKEEWVRAVVNGNKAVVVNTSATEIYDFRGDPVSSITGITLSTAKLMIWGKAVTFAFYDEILIFQGVVFVLSSTTISGSPPARSYSIAADRVRASVASGDALFQTAGISMPDSGGL